MVVWISRDALARVSGPGGLPPLRKQQCLFRKPVPRRPVKVRAKLIVQARNILLFTKAEAGKAGITLDLSDARAQHIQGQLKSQPGDLLRIGVINGLKGTALVKEIGDSAVRLSWNTWQEPQAPAPITLLLAMPRPKVLRRLFATLSELGVQEVVITKADKVEAGYQSSKALQEDIIVQDLLTGLEQAGETVLPNILYSTSLRNSLACIESTDPDIVSEEWETTSINVQRLVFGPEVPKVMPNQGPSESGLATSSTGDQQVQASQHNISPQSNGQRMAFITQCLQVRRNFEDQRTGASVTASEETTFEAPPPLTTLKLVAHPGVPWLLSDMVMEHKQRMNSAGLTVWDEVYKEEPAARVEPGRVARDPFDRYYGSNNELVSPSPGTLRPAGDVMIGQDWDYDVDVGTTAIDTSKWGQGRVVIAVGPEGGWTDRELDTLQAAGYLPVGLGGRTLSTTTATISLLAIIQEALR